MKNSNVNLLGALTGTALTGVLFVVGIGLKLGMLGAMVYVVVLVLQSMGVL